jgi:CubicO group peptidase (beta-lactamase class C family)
MKNLLRFTLLFSFLISFLLFQGSNLWAQQDSTSDAIAQIERGISDADDELAKLSIEELLEQLNVPGVSVAVIKDFSILWSKGYGTADVVAGTAVDTETLFQAASISKPVNAMAILKAAEDGHFSIDQDINSVITGWQIPESQFTQNEFVSARMLASHTSGLGDGFGFPGYDPSEPLPTLQQIFDGEEPSNVGVVRVVRPPMTAYHYSGGGVTILQQALIDTYNQPYAELMQELVLNPVGMTQSTFEQPLPAELDRNAARAHSFRGEASGPKWHVYPEQAAAGLWTTSTDLAKFAIEVQLSAQNRSNAVLNQESTKEMLSPVGVGPFAVGFSITKRGEGWYFDHGGSNFGFQAQLTAHLSKGYGYAIMTNSPPGRRLIQELGRRIEASYFYDSNATPVRR